MRDSGFKDLRIPVVVTADKERCDIYIPDLSVTIHGNDFIEAMANACLKASAMYFYNLERNYQFSLETKYEEACSMCDTKDKFVTYVSLMA